MLTRFFATIICLFALVGARAAKPDFPIMKTSELKPGMTGYGLTVFHDTTIEKFPVTIMGIMPGFFAGQDLIIIEAKHPLLEGIGIVAGMSGSPVYIDDKLIGAVAYGWGFSTRGIGGVTPVESMLEVYDEVTDKSQVDDREYAGDLDQWPEAKSAMMDHQPAPLNVPAAEFARMGIDIGGQNYATLRPLSTPLMISTRSQLVMQEAERLFSGSLLDPVMAGASMGAGDDSADIVTENGSAFGAKLVEGDLDVSAVGTATFVDKDKLVGFGHPMFGEGAIDIPICAAEVVAVVPSQQRPFKLANSRKTIGAMRQDRLPAVGASLHAEAAMVPITVRIDADETQSREYHFKAWHDRGYLPSLAMMCFMESMDRTVRTDGPMILDMTTNIELEDGRAIAKTDTFSGPGMVSFGGGMYMASVLGAIANNRFAAAPIKSIRMIGKVRRQQKLMALKRVIHNDDAVHPGDTISGTVEYTRWRTDSDTVPFTLQVPKSVKPGSYELHVMDGPSRLALEKQFRPELARIESLDDLLRTLQPTYRSDNLYILLIDPKEETVIDGMRLVDLPKTVVDAVKSTVRDNQQLTTAKGRLIAEESRHFDAAIIGDAMIPITVADR